MIVQANNDIGACYGVAKRAEIVFDRGKMVKGEGLHVLSKIMKTADRYENEIYKFLGAEQTDGIEKKKMYNGVNKENSRRMNIMTRTELNNENLVEAINIKVYLVASYPVNVCKFTQNLNLRD